MSWSENTLSRCNNSTCAKQIYWNELIRHPVTKRLRPLDKPYYPDQSPTPNLHLCMKQNPPKKFIKKYFNDEALDGINYNHELYVFVTRGYPQ